MTNLLHTKGYAEVLESVKMLAQKKAGEVVAEDGFVGQVLGDIGRMAEVEVALAACSVASYLTGIELADLQLTFAEDFIHHYRFELGQIRSERVAAEELAEVQR